MNTKNCKYCNNIFYKKYSHSKKYWESASFCSVRCGRMANNPAKKEPNRILETDDGKEVFIIVNGKNGEDLFLVDKKDYIELGIKDKRWFSNNGGSRNGRYAYFSYTTKEGEHKHKSLHSYIMGNKNGYVIDHIDLNTLDNRRSNLRYLSKKDNIRNQIVKNKLGVTGADVSPSGKIRVRIRFDGKNKYVGTYETVEKAIEGRIQAEKKYWGRSFIEEKVSIGL